MSELRNVTEARPPPPATAEDDDEKAEAPPETASGYSKLFDRGARSFVRRLVSLLFGALRAVPLKPQQLILLLTAST